MKKKRIELRFAGLSATTLRAYRKAIDTFVKKSRIRDLHATRASRLDRLIGDYMEEAFQEGDPISYSGHLLSALKRFYPHLRQRLPLATQLYRNWVKTYVPRRATPASWQLVEAMIGLCLAQHLPELALLLGVGFHCMLRTSELLALSHRHFVFHPRGNGLSIAIPGSKTSSGNPQVLLVVDEQLIQLAKSVVTAQGTSTIWTDSSAAFRTRFDLALVGLGFESGSYVPYALRRGGATHHFQATLSLDSTVQRGRWACSKTARQYIDEGSYQLAQVCWSSKQARLVRQWRKRGRVLRLRQRK